MNYSPCSFDLQPLECRTLLAAQVVGYLPDYEYTSTINKIVWADLTRLNYFSIRANSKTGKLITDDPDVINLAHLGAAAQKAHQHDVKIDIVIGGADLDGSFTHIAASNTRRKALAVSVQSFCSTYHLDGVDLDWEPANPTAAQISDFGKLIHVLKTHTSGLKLSAAVNAEKLPIAPANTSSQYLLNPSAIADLDRINVMAYDLDFARHAPVTRSETDLNAWGQYLTDHGVSKQKLLFGLPFYGRAGTSWDTSQAQGYGDIVDAYVSQTGKSPAPGVDHLNISFAGEFDNKKVTWYFNGPNTMVNKTFFALDNGFGGVMIWNLGLDHFDKHGKTDQFSLLPAIQRQIDAQG